MLEQQCEMIEDILIMPDDLQADVIVPIVNFMYTGTLEFQYSMFDKLLKTAHDMNMTVLLKLLEAHRSATRNVNVSRQPILLNKQAPRVVTNSTSYTTRQRPVQRTTVVKQEPSAQKVVFKHHQTTIKPLATAKQLPEPVAVIAKYSHQVPNSRGPTRFEMDDQVLAEGFEEHFDSISYESKPLLTADQAKRDDESSLFEKLKKDVQIKRPAPSTLSPPVAKKPNLEDVKELTENLRLRKQLGGEDAEEDADEYYDDQETGPKTYSATPTSTTRSAQISVSPKTTISIKEEGVNVNHAKIISEVLKKYPHLVKNNKNIKLKILQKSPIASNSETVSIKTTPPTAKVYPTKIATNPPSQPVTRLVQKISPQVKPQTPQTPAQAVPPRPKRIDAKTMHELIAKGAENTTGPWLCLRCGIDGRPISIPSYKSFRKHLVSVHKEKIDARLCEECGFRSADRNDLYQHLFDEHNIQVQKREPHKVEQLVKTESGVKAIQQCAYCSKVFLKETTLNTHIKTYHRDQAILDGVIRDEGYVPNNPSVQTDSKAKGIQVLSNIALSTKLVIDPNSQIATTAQKLEPSSEAEALSNVASGIATSLTLVGTTDMTLDEHYSQELASGEYITTQQLSDAQKDTGARLVTSDGSELQLSAAQKEEILSQLQNSDGGNVIMVLNHEPFDENQGTVVSTAGLTTANNIMVVYSQANETGPVVVSDSTPPTQAVQAIQQQQSMENVDVVKDETLTPINDPDQSMEDMSANENEQQIKATPLAAAEETEAFFERVTNDDHLNVEEQLKKVTGGDVESTSETDPTISTTTTIVQPQPSEADEKEQDSIVSSAYDESLSKSESEAIEDAEKAKQSLISTLQGEW